MKKRSLRCIIGIVILMLCSVFVLSGCKKKSEEEQKTPDVEDELQVEESDEGNEGPSVDFEDVFSDENEENNTNTNQGNTVPDNNKGGNKEEVKQENNKEDDKEDPKEDDEEDDQEVLTGVEENKEQGWGPFY